MDIKDHPQWPAIVKIVKKLKKNGFTAFVAGGAVRDMLMGREAADIDIATNATPDQIEPLFKKVVMVGKEFGVCRVVIEDMVVEVATFRSDGNYQDGRRPESVTFSSPKEDAMRRDFTINGMFYEIHDREVVDYVEGRSDLNKRVIRAIGNPQKRFAEDKLRILRGLRFLSELEMPLDRGTAEAMMKNAADLKKVSQERITIEWEKLLQGPAASAAIQLTQKMGIWKVMFADWPYKVDDYEKIFSGDPMDSDQTWAVWFMLHWRDNVEDLAARMMEWKLPKDTVQKTVFTATNYDLIAQFPEMEDVDVALFVGHKWGLFAAEVYQEMEHKRDLTKWIASLSQISKYFDKGQLPKAIVTGDDLIAQGMKEGPAMAKKLKEIYRRQLKDGITDKKSLLE